MTNRRVKSETVSLAHTTENYVRGRNETFNCKTSFKQEWVFFKIILDFILKHGGEKLNIIWFLENGGCCCDADILKTEEKLQKTINLLNKQLKL